MINDRVHHCGWIFVYNFTVSKVQLATYLDKVIDEYNGFNMQKKKN